jgi:hypothetical protein
MHPKDWVSVTESGERLSARIISARLADAGIPLRVSEPQSSAGQCSIWVPADRASEARRILSEVSVTDEELTALALAEPPPDDMGSDAPVQEQVGAFLAKAFVAVAVIIFVGIALLAFGSLVHLANPCVNTLLWEVPSPDARLKVSVIRRQCPGSNPVGGVSILSATRFIGRMGVGNVLANVAHPGALSIRWEGPRTVVIGCRADDALNLSKPWFMSEYGVVRVRLEPMSSTP